MPPVSDQPHTNTTSPADWKYVSEGGATIVFSYRGPLHPVFSGTVLRLRKTSRNLNADGESHRETESGQLEGEGEEPDDHSILFQRSVTSQLIEPNDLPRLESVRVERSWLEALKAATEKSRPPGRQSKDELDVRRCKAVLATDLVRGDGWAVEIKPKWGFLPNLKYLSPETRVVKSTHCRFCLHSRYKAKKGESASHGYCPLDLYSNNSERVSHALRCLWKAWTRSNGTVNNLKVFARGELVHPAECKLQPVLSGPSNTVGEAALMERFVGAMLPLLTGTPVLQRIAQLQRALDALDIEGLFALYVAYAKLRFPKSPESAKPLEDLFPDPTLDDWERFVATFQTQQPPTDLDPALLHYHAMGYLLSATFKDCSIMLHLGQGPDVPDNITVIDLDPKSMKRLKRWAELDHDIAVSFVESGLQPCHDEHITVRAGS
ncbi:uncharacterized protein FOMMEDRAFT_88227 [Fomitiporia mediterranea MF3/22]|uniref:uncharacterized protein n=1 Tax=Fomitiporia mediterranea (strain MF3/22) TaxID=694068 RepID=UPI0004407F09|nr:uncharacterized protein FOMMEDRAFT_88227 [Fomitiporia mediterranea MF3/22]EJD02222.1 hypothetical protein FOMMEDRAFT_88227 [Fomitiporia mediterranea MF3/22]